MNPTSSPKWKRKHCSQKFLSSLRRDFGRRIFSLQQAYDTYHYFHWRSWRKLSREEARKVSMDNWGEMNARNTLAAAIHFGELKHVSKGRYRF